MLRLLIVRYLCCCVVRTASTGLPPQPLRLLVVSYLVLATGQPWYIYIIYICIYICLAHTSYIPEQLDVWLCLAVVHTDLSNRYSHIEYS